MLSLAQLSSAAGFRQSFTLPELMLLQICLQRWIWEVQAVPHSPSAAVLLHLLFLCELQVRCNVIINSWMQLCEIQADTVSLNVTLGFRFSDVILNFLLVWYYCTLTIRESILITNGSRSAPPITIIFFINCYNLFIKELVHYRIKGWWVFHHYISVVLSSVMLTWWVE